LVELLLDPPHPAEKALDFLLQQVAPQLLRGRRQFQLPEPDWAFLRP
jgi:hypothetical protein